MKKLEKNLFNDFISGLLNNYSLIAPVEIEKGKGTVYQPVSNPEQINLSSRNTKKSVKEIFFPQEETLFLFKKGGQEVYEPEKPSKKTILFGVRSCDLKGVETFDQIFLSGQFVDTYYEKRRKNTLIFSLACFDHDDHCFCESFGINKMKSSVADAAFYDMGNYYIIEPVSKESQSIFSSLPDASDKEIEVYAEKKSTASKQEKIDVDKFVKVLGDNFEHPVWDEVSDKCIGCSVCAYLCPTCHCFDVNDEVTKDKGRRYRTWDACMFSKFTLHTSGHNPRTKNSQRMRQRVLHKFNYLDKNKNIVACSGCGRCIINCPVSLDIRDIFKKILADLV